MCAYDANSMFCEVKRRSVNSDCHNIRKNYVNVSAIVNFSPFILPFCYCGNIEILLSIDRSVVKRMTVNV